MNIYHIVGAAWGVGGSAMNKTSFLFLYNMYLEGGDSSKQVVTRKWSTASENKNKITERVVK